MNPSSSFGASSSPNNKSPLKPLSVDDLRSPSPQRELRGNRGSFAPSSVEKKFVPSHLMHLTASQRKFAPDVSSPLNEFFDSHSGIRSSTSPSSKFGGPSFGTPKPFLRANRLGGSSIIEDAPPTQSIYDFPSSRQISTSNVDQITASPLSSPFTARTLNSPMEPLKEVSRSVIVFGFPPELTTQVLNEFSRFGKIVNQHSLTASTSALPGLKNAHGNWLQLTYAEPSSAATAVQSNGMIIHDSFMVGCIYSPDDKQSHSQAATKLDALDIEMTEADTKGIPPLTTQLEASAQFEATIGKRIVVQHNEDIFKSSHKDPSKNWFVQNLFGNTSNDTIEEEEKLASVTDNKTGQSSLLGKSIQVILHTLFGF
ncbi:nucleoporin Nup40 [Schizosaccharomyces cryophilus OY26]|uniref:Nucleoporin Nup40 n=1 Tax=Schizosaccharomyces cryophilus (strain OY26 / ATCC MYA-4695 / CBS 11777 / NBRC 106824 / NRRL Y48691) TaxID=653667 RepID=S9VSQ9_SCHCR|nr:nucleoporin Nup40, variant [Schizosaccharomyces cryophilus OY26]XP_013024171.1 nucleoporin Nup40 [Schizosaccharomyces cryophilus OY26]EPY50922.1 nucleoporin Nup40, variant [Schizosaccharomyces cryophilus OY26]EPY50923.1 nucleoporin Nup40 [Schizosaccharomyces cryophilus OY26]